MIRKPETASLVRSGNLPSPEFADAAVTMKSAARSITRVVKLKGPVGAANAQRGH
jgi:hypothetical protein